MHPPLLFCKHKQAKKISGPVVAPAIGMKVFSISFACEIITFRSPLLSDLFLLLVILYFYSILLKRTLKFISAFSSGVSLQKRYLLFTEDPPSVARKA